MDERVMGFIIKARRNDPWARGLRYEFPVRPLYVGDQCVNCLDVIRLWGESRTRLAPSETSGHEPTLIGIRWIPDGAA